ncbi:hypothetical protein N9541_06195 [Flavobacteriaceae bacterium]|nr:hypothetical protein [Flavobacteriaceae bacterium]
MKEIIKKYIGVIGVLIAFLLSGIAVYYKYYFNNDVFEVLAILAIILLGTTTSLEHELKKEKPKNWLITLVTGTFFIAIFLVLFS